MFGAIVDEFGASSVGNARRISLDGRSWLVGDVRLDGRAELCSVLSVGNASDEALCLHAYLKWGKKFVDHLAGDFCFALWDDASAELICARDQLGVRPLFYAKMKDGWLVSNSIAWIVSQPGIDCALDDYWIADFLIVGHCLEFGRTAYRFINRLPPANVLTISSAGAIVRRYWQLELGEPIYYRDRVRYIEQFSELIARAIGDRLPSGRVGISLSGGLDSSTLAVFAVDIAADAARVTAETRYFERLITDDEQHFSSLVARRLGIRHRLRGMDDLSYDPHWRTRSFRMAEPTAYIVRAHPELAIAHQMAREADVWFFGEGPDNALLFEPNAYLSWLLGRRDWWRLATTTAQHLEGRTTRDWVRFFTSWVAPKAAAETADKPPPWIEQSFLQSLHLVQRLRDLGEIARPRHPWHPRSVASFSDPIWQSFLGSFDPSGTAQPPIEWRHPYLDLRVLQFLLSVPPIPWARHKLLIREAMQNRLPEELLRRRKTTLPQSPLWQAVKTHQLPALSGGGRLSHYVDERRLPAVFPSEAEMWRVVSVHALDHWLTPGES